MASPLFVFGLYPKIFPNKYSNNSIYKFKTTSVKPCSHFEKTPNKLSFIELDQIEGVSFVACVQPVNPQFSANL